MCQSSRVSIITCVNNLNNGGTGPAGAGRRRRDTYSLYGPASTVVAATTRRKHRSSPGPSMAPGRVTGMTDGSPTGTSGGHGRPADSLPGPLWAARRAPLGGPARRPGRVARWFRRPGGVSGKPPPRRRRSAPRRPGWGFGPGPRGEVRAEGDASTRVGPGSGGAASPVGADGGPGALLQILVLKAPKTRNIGNKEKQ